MQRILLVSALSLSVGACAPRVIHIPHSMPAEVQLNLSKLPRVWVAGFATDRKPEFDVSLETVRLLRTQLRTWSSAPVIEAEPLTIDTEKRLSDVVYWRRLGEEHGWPLIVTGSVRLLLAPPQIVQRGQRTMYLPRAGRVLESTVVLIDGRSGEIVSTHKLPSRMRYGMGRFSSGLTLFLQMMDQAMPDWFMAIAATSTAAESPSKITSHSRWQSGLLTQLSAQVFGDLIEAFRERRGLLGFRPSYDDRRAPAILWTQKYTTNPTPTVAW